MSELACELEYLLAKGGREIEKENWYFVEVNQFKLCQTKSKGV